MKLKRFLLRYDPPGIGLEVEEEGACQVVHKDLPQHASVTTTKDINSVVDSLIAEESVLLTKRRHRPALVQLLGRLYQVEVEPTDDEGDLVRGSAPERGVAQPAAASRDESPSDGGILEGQQVVLIGLKGKQQIHNGELATVVKARGEKQKYEVLINASRSTEGGETLKVKGVEHMVPLAKGLGLAVGTHVAIRGLRNHIELNGCLGRVVECHEESHRFEVRATESGQLFRVKQENLIPIEAIASVIGASKENNNPNTSKDGGGALSSREPIDASASDQRFDGEVFELGSTVQLFGLKTAMNYNGQTAEVLSVDRARCRYEIRLGDGSVKTIRAENLHLVSGPSKSSPRTRRAKEGGGPSKPKA